MDFRVAASEILRSATISTFTPLFLSGFGIALFCPYILTIFVCSCIEFYNTINILLLQRYYE